MSKARSQHERDEANRQYFQSLAETRASLTNLSGMAFITAVLLSLVTVVILFSAIFFAEGNTVLLSLFYAHLVLIGFSVLMMVLSAFRGWVFRFQVFSSGLVFLFAVIGWVYTLCFMMLGLAALVPDAGSAMVSLDRLSILATIGFLYVFGATVVHIFLLRKRLREGHSEERMMGNYSAISSAYLSKSLRIIVAISAIVLIVLIVINVLTGGEYVLLSFWFLGFLFIASVTTSLPVEFGYLVYLKSQDKQYWEKRDPKIPRQPGALGRIFKSLGKGVLIVAGGIAALTLLGWILGFISELFQ